MNIWIVSDTHFGHDRIVEFCKRPPDHSQRILDNISKFVKNEDILLHLGDICFYEEAKWNHLLRFANKGKQILVRGNHDSKSDTWYYERGWDFVCDSFGLNKYGKNLLFTHHPQRDGVFDLNIHGHLHNSDHRKVHFKMDRHKLIKMEHEYKPYSLRSLV